MDKEHTKGFFKSCMSICYWGDKEETEVGV